MKIEGAIDLTLVVVMLAIAIWINSYSLKEITKQEDEVVREDKNLVQDLYYNEPADYTMDTSDIILMCLIQDTYIPAPGKFKINDKPEQLINYDWIIDRSTRTANVYQTQLRPILNDKGVSVCDIADFDFKYDTEGNTWWQINIP